MRSLIFAMLCLIMYTQGKAQFFVGETKQLVKSTLKEKNVVFTESKLSDTTSRISWLVQNQYQMIFVFDLADSVIRQTLIPEKVDGVNDFVKWFNKDFVVVSDTEWKNYSNGKIHRIKLEYIGREPFFSILLSAGSK